MSVQGYAIKTPDGISVKTVSPTAVGAVVNWLVVFANVYPPSDSSTNDIDRMFQSLARHYEATLVRVTVAEVLEQ